MDDYLAIVSKREVRDYADRPIEPGAVRRILEAGRVSGSSANKQQWRFFVVESADKRERLAELVYVPGNVRGAGLIVVVAMPAGSGRAFYDVGRVSQNMMLAAWNEGIGSCPNGTPDPGEVGALLGLAGDEEPGIIITFGYPARPVDPESRSPEEWIARANRKPFDEVVKTV
jgi:nitroreductase